MKIKDWLENWGLSSLTLRLPFFEMEFDPQPDDENAAWAMYIELVTRITTQPLDDYEGDEEAALESIHSFFSATREILKEYGRKCPKFTGIAITALNHNIRPFAAKWHQQLKKGTLGTAEGKALFRDELKSLQKVLRYYANTLSKIARAEDYSGFINPLD